MRFIRTQHAELLPVSSTTTRAIKTRFLFLFVREGKAIKINYVQQVWVYQISVQKDYYTHHIIKNLNHIVEFTRVDKSSEVRF